MATIELPPNVWTAVIGVSGLWDIEHRNTGAAPYRIAVGLEPPSSSLTGNIFASSERGDLTISSATIWARPINSGNGQITIEARSLGPSGATVTPQDFGAVGDGVTDDGAAFQAFVDYLLEDPTIRVGTAVGQFVSATDVVNLHAVQIEGAGRLKIGAGDWWRFNSNEKNTNFGSTGYNTLYAAPSGTATASGLSSSFPVSITQAITILGKLSAPLQGLYRIRLAEGVYTTPINLFDVSTSRGKPLYIEGPARDTWDRTALPLRPKPIVSMTSANPPVVTATAHGFSNGDKVFIGLAEDAGGMHDGDGAIYTIANVTTDTFELSGVDGSGWGAYTGAGVAFSCEGSAPLAIFYGAGTVANGIAFDGAMNAEIRDVAGIGWSTKAGATDHSFIRAKGVERLVLNNVHAHYCSIGVTIREGGAELFWNSGQCYECWTGMFCIQARYTVGVSNASSVLDTTPLFENITFGIHVWEGGAGHADGMEFRDCTITGYIRKGGHAVLVENNIINSSGVPRQGLIVEDRAFLDGVPNNWSGLFTPSILRRGFSVRAEQNTALGWLTRVRQRVTPPTPGGGEATLFTLPVYQNEMRSASQGVRVTLHLSGTWANDNVTIRLKLGAATIYTSSIGANASARNVMQVIDMIPLQNGNVNTITRRNDTVVSSGATVIFFTTNQFQTSFADQNFVGTLEVVDAGDALTNVRVEVEALGW